MKLLTIPTPLPTAQKLPPQPLPSTPKPPTALTFCLVARGRFQDVAVDQERPDGFGGGVPVGLLDRLVHVRVADQVRRTAHVRVLVQAVSPVLKDTFASPDVVGVLGQLVDQLLQFRG